MSILRGISGERELGRTLGWIGGLNYVVWPPVFQGYALCVHQAWDAASFCAAYGGGFGLMATGIGALIALKDRAVTNAMAGGGTAP